MLLCYCNLTKLCLLFSVHVQNLHKRTDDRKVGFQHLSESLKKLLHVTHVCMFQVVICM